MPLPPAPTTPADRLPPKAFEASARSTNRPARKPATVEVAPPQPSGRTAPQAKARENVRKSVPSLLTPSVAPPVVTRAPSPAAVPAETGAGPSTARARKAPRTGPTKLFVLDTH
ncbi:MAG: hypothetical protein WA174_13835, partial [Rhodoferax sp.]